MKKMFKRIHSLTKSIFDQIKEGEVQLVARSLSFSTVLCIIPFFAVTIAILQSVAGWDRLSLKVENFLLLYLKDVVGPDAIRVIKLSIRNVNLSKLGLSGVGFLFLTTVRLFFDMETAINRVWNIKIKRRLLTRISIHSVLIFVIPIVLAVYVSFSSLKSFKIAETIAIGKFSDFLVLFTLLYLIFKWIPNTVVKSFHAVTCALLATFGIYIVHSAFIEIMKVIFAYRKIYGGFAALPLLLLWIISLWHVVLAGAALNAALNKESEKLSI